MDQLFNTFIEKTKAEAASLLRTNTFDQETGLAISRAFERVIGHTATLFATLKATAHCIDSTAHQERLFEDTVWLENPAFKKVVFRRKRAEALLESTIARKHKLHGHGIGAEHLEIIARDIKNEKLELSRLVDLETLLRNQSATIEKQNEELQVVKEIFQAQPLLREQFVNSCRTLQSRVATTPKCGVYTHVIRAVQMPSRNGTPASPLRGSKSTATLLPGARKLPQRPVKRALLTKRAPSMIGNADWMDRPSSSLTRKRKPVFEGVRSPVARVRPHTALARRGAEPQPLFKDRSLSLFGQHVQFSDRKKDDVG